MTLIGTGKPASWGKVGTGQAYWVSDRRDLQVPESKGFSHPIDSGQSSINARPVAMDVVAREPREGAKEACRDQSSGAEEKSRKESDTMPAQNWWVWVGYLQPSRGWSLLSQRQERFF